MTAIDDQPGLPAAVSLLFEQQPGPYAPQARGHDMGMASTMKIVPTDARQKVIDRQALQRELSEAVKTNHGWCVRQILGLLEILQPSLVFRIIAERNNNSRPIPEQDNAVEATPTRYRGRLHAEPLKKSSALRNITTVKLQPKKPLVLYPGGQALLAVQGQTIELLALQLKHEFSAPAGRQNKANRALREFALRYRKS